MTTTPDFAAVAKSIGGSHVSVTPMSLPTQDPHFVDPRPHLALKLAKADLLLLAGLSLEVGWLPTLLTGARNGDIQPGGRGYVDCSQFVDKMDVPQGSVDRSMGDVHPGGNPHYMFDPRRAAQVAEGIAARMADLDPDRSDAYEAGLQRFLSRLSKARKRWEKKLSGLKGEAVIAYHRSFTYFADWLGLKVADMIEPRPGIPPNPRHVANVLGLAKKRSVEIVLQERWYPTNASKLIAERTGATLVRIPGGPDVKNGESYLDFLNGVVAKLAAAGEG